MMRYLISVAVAVLAGVLLLAGMAMAQTNGYSDSPLVANGSPQAEGYIVEQARISGGGYNLTSPGEQVTGMASGGGYQLLDAFSLNVSPPPSSQVGCCCTYLPCLLRNY